MEEWFWNVGVLLCKNWTALAMLRVTKDIGEGDASGTPETEPQEEKACPQPRLGNGFDLAFRVEPQGAQGRVLSFHRPECQRMS